jgi:cation transport ATPase
MENGKWELMRVMRETEQRRPRLRRLGDELGARYTPIALATASLAWVMSGEPKRFLATVVVATPCPLVIAIPVAVIGAISRSARRGIIIKNPAVLEQVDRCRTLIFGKTELRPTANLRCFKWWRLQDSKRMKCYAWQPVSRATRSIRYRARFWKPRRKRVMHIGRRMRRIALESAVGGMGLSVLGMVAAAFGYLPPIGGAIAQEIIDLAAILNAVRVAIPPRIPTDF